ncbi:glucose-6-phosphate isomerase [Legionella spiritensis]|uniref:glucose-6-phosphate isomerase n=1 Tax=Legionella spiritensis TaxID=452 RepID=UPI000F6B8B28|nr:glucose-6-phosphate isomerase [Legionella spiritensis]VEG91591.1 glucose-6-phosphate isomerase [Legionella spiritensis]
MSYLTSTAEWRALENHTRTLNGVRIEQLLQSHTQRKKHYRHAIGAVTVDMSKNYFTPETMRLLYQLAEQSQIQQTVKSLFCGEKLNFTEDRAVLHPALRSPAMFSAEPHGKTIAEDVYKTLSRMEQMTLSLQNGHFNDISVKHIVNIGIGGSDLGPRMVLAALAPYRNQAITVDFISNLDAWDTNVTLSRLDPEHTLFIISSKSFKTYETLLNAEQAMKWLGSKERGKQQCIAVTANHEAARNFGIAEQNILPIWEWVGGRYSVWSAIGLPIALGTGFDTFQQFLYGASLVDEHMLHADPDKNLPLCLALLDCWTINFLGADTRAIIPYSERFHYFIPYIQQLVMESNGKSTDIDGNKINYSTGPIIWGGIGCNSQHAFHQLLMQGTQLVHVDFIGVKKALDDEQQHQQNLLNNQLIAQSEALLKGNMDRQSCNHRGIPGNIPHNLIMLEQLTPAALGTLLAIYEYRTILTALLWRINPFDQFGVELGKEIAVTRSGSAIMDDSGSLKNEAMV